MPFFLERQEERLRKDRCEVRVLREQSPSETHSILHPVSLPYYMEKFLKGMRSAARDFFNYLARYFAS